MSVALKAAAAAGVPVLGWAMLALAFVQFWRWTLKFIGERWDAHIGRVSVREAAADKKIDDRVRHLEAQQATDATLIAGLYKALNILMIRVAKESPFDPALVEVRDIIAAALNVVDSEVPAGDKDLVDQLRKQPYP